MKKLVKYTAFGAVCLSFALCGHAGEFNVVCSYKNENLKKCASIVSDVITDKFTTKFSTKKFSIFAYSDIHSYSNGGYAAYAVVGVVPRGSGEFPVKHFSTSTMNGEKRLSGLELAGIELENYRDAIQQLMDKCEISQSCDVYTPKDRSN